MTHFVTHSNSKRSSRKLNVCPSVCLQTCSLYIYAHNRAFSIRAHQQRECLSETPTPYPILVHIIMMWHILWPTGDCDVCQGPVPAVCWLREGCVRQVRGGDQHSAPQWSQHTRGVSQHLHHIITQGIIQNQGFYYRISKPALVPNEKGSLGRSSTEKVEL